MKNSRWEGYGQESRFIRCLIAAYEEVEVGRKRNEATAFLYIHMNVKPQNHI